MEKYFRFMENGLDIITTTKGCGNMLYQRGGKEVWDNYLTLSKESGIPLNRIVRVVLKNGSEFIKVDNSHGGEGVYPDKQNLQGLDGLITTEKNLYLGITTADCYPVIIHDKKKSFLGLAHCGWRGIVEGLEVKILNELIQMGSNLDDIQIVYGPGICGNCYIQHDQYLKDIFINKYNYPEDIINPQGKYYSVDIKKASQHNLKKAGFKGSFIDLNICNYCDERFFSVRREGKDTGRMLNLVCCI
ncbi:polyphenol oxidase family protein [Anaerobranca gottschalkii]|uniref:Purine nucleoside phosphorylase n=1 Tax=Anaerobranca gottschalkii DSM 13577 TaxID=1120990 RepID=A0A1I0CKS1_9FIRM|nr:polyphenol oxidase family protein [Anaerobranca gottschalkii]SET20041.1 conserved hypothetical protein [Anaerobranca gottschalkii DSM 13577]